MKQYKVFRHPAGKIEAVKQGWSWPAFIFSSFWALYKKLWFIGFGFFIPLLIVGFILGASGADDSITYIIELIVSVLFGMKGNAWREKNLLKRGFDHVETLTAASPEGAIALFIKSTGSSTTLAESNA